VLGESQPMKKVYVTVYNESQAYGGSEEGGWYYTVSEPVDSLCTLCCGVMGKDDFARLPHHQEALEQWFLTDPLAHEDTCPAKGAAETYHRQYVLGHTEAYLRSFTHRPDGVSWLDSGEDAPEEFRGERATDGKHYVRIEEEPPDASPPGRPHYE